MLLTDGRFSGGTTGLCVGHVAPEAVDAGPIAFVRDGDPIRLDVSTRTLDLLVDDEELAPSARRLGAAAAEVHDRRAVEVPQAGRLGRPRRRLRLARGASSRRAAQSLDAFLSVDSAGRRASQPRRGEGPAK